MSVLTLATMRRRVKKMINSNPIKPMTQAQFNVVYGDYYRSIVLEMEAENAFAERMEHDA